MSAAIERPEDTAGWASALSREEVDWDAFLGAYAATVDWPACAFWRELSEAYPDAVVLLSTRGSAEEWWGSFEQTILATLSQPVPDDDADWQARRKVTLGVVERCLGPEWRERQHAIAAYERHAEAVRAAIPAERLVDWSVGDGWAPLCDALGVPVPAEEFPHTNRTAAFRAENVR
jgi:hypothetical protein